MILALNKRDAIIPQGACCPCGRKDGTPSIILAKAVESKDGTWGIILIGCPEVF